jgi:hypothetical protein
MLPCTHCAQRRVTLPTPVFAPLAESYTHAAIRFAGAMTARVLQHACWFVKLPPVPVLPDVIETWVTLEEGAATATPCCLPCALLAARLAAAPPPGCPPGAKLVVKEVAALTTHF